MFRKLNSNKRKMGESSSATLKPSTMRPQSEGVVDDSPSSVTPPTAAPVAQAAVPPSLAATPPTTGLPPLTPSRLSASDSLLSSAPQDPLAFSFNLARQTLDFMYQHDSVKGVPSEDPEAILRTTMLDTSRVSIHHAPLFVLSGCFLTLTSFWWY